MESLVPVTVVLLMLAINAVFACYEMALAAISRARLEVLLQANRRGARCAAYMKDRLEGSLAVIQLGITLAGAIAAATGGAGVDEWLSPRIARALDVSAGTSEFLALVLLVVPLSAVTIVFAELIPKVIGINDKEGVLLALSPVMKGVARVFHPVVFVFEAVVRMLMRLGPTRWRGESTPQDRTGLLELRAAAALARATRIIGPLEERIVMSAAQLSVRTVANAMVPTRDISTIPADATLADALIEAHTHMHTRYPVCTETGNPQSISGYVTFKDIVTAIKVEQNASSLRSIVRPIRRVEGKTSLAQALTDMIRDRIHIILVTAAGSVVGLVTMEDIVEELVGDLHDEYDRLPTQLHVIGGGWLVGGGVLIGDLAKAMGGSVFLGADAKLTLADWLDRAREVPVRSGETLRADGVEVQVRKVRRKRVSEATVRAAGETGGHAA